METYVAVMDTLILAWLVGTWFYEGHHRQCEVEVTCNHCGKTKPTWCTANDPEKE